MSSAWPSTVTLPLTLRTLKSPPFNPPCMVMLALPVRSSRVTSPWAEVSFTSPWRPRISISPRPVLNSKSSVGGTCTSTSITVKLSDGDSMLTRTISSRARSASAWAFSASARARPASARDRALSPPPGRCRAGDALRGVTPHRPSHPPGRRRPPPRAHRRDDARPGPAWQLPSQPGWNIRIYSRRSAAARNYSLQFACVSAPSQFAPAHWQLCQIAPA